MELSRESQMSLMKIEKIKGAKLEPCGAPLDAVNSSDLIRYTLHNGADLLDMK